ncbi:MAG: hypothetical protein HQ556_03300 [Candidatus Marinimicrobia bacterium]|nr:hypothetical protein [Candidatus Neomarinimicrobiota bacterium]
MWILLSTIVLGITVVIFGYRVSEQMITLNRVSYNDTDSVEISRRIVELKALNVALTQWLIENQIVHKTQDFQDVVLKHLEKLNHLKLKQLSQISVDQKSVYSDQFEISISGPYPQVMKLINRVETKLPVSSITYLNIKGQTDGEVDCHFRVGILRMPEPAGDGSA